LPADPVISRHDTSCRKATRIAKAPHGGGETLQPWLATGTVKGGWLGAVRVIGETRPGFVRPGLGGSGKGMEHAIRTGVVLSESHGDEGEEKIITDRSLNIARSATAWQSRSRLDTEQFLTESVDLADSAHTAGRDLPLRGGRERT